MIRAVTHYLCEGGGDLQISAVFKSMLMAAHQLYFPLSFPSTERLACFKAQDCTHPHRSAFLWTIRNAQANRRLRAQFDSDENTRDGSGLEEGRSWMRRSDLVRTEAIPKRGCFVGKAKMRLGEMHHPPNGVFSAAFKERRSTRKSAQAHWPPEGRKRRRSLDPLRVFRSMKSPARCDQ